MPRCHTEDAERRIAEVLLTHWDPLRVRDTPGGRHEEYLGARALRVRPPRTRRVVPVQVSRYLHRVESAEDTSPRASPRKISAPLLTALRAIDLDA